MRHTPHQLLLFTWGGVACQADAGDRQETSTCKGGSASRRKDRDDFYFKNGVGPSEKDMSQKLA